VRVNITPAFILAEVRKGHAKSRDYADSKVHGLSMRISPSGVVSWSTRRRMPDNRYSRVRVGQYPAVGVAEARKQALKVQGAMQTGSDPVAERRATRARAAADKARMSVSDAWAAYSTAKISGGGWGEGHANNARLFAARVLLPSLGKKALADVTRSDWSSVIAAEGRKGRGAKATALRFIRALDSFAETSGWIERTTLPRKASVLAPPCKPREHAPDDDTIVAIWHAAATLRPKPRAFVRLLILCACRRGELAGIRAGEVDLAAGLWTLPASRSKNRHSHLMPLCEAAKAELHAIWPPEPVEPRFCLLGESGIAPLQGFSRIKRALAKALGDDAWRLHDFRRSARTTMSRLGIASDAAESALAHRTHLGGLRGTYDRHDFRDEAVAALRVWQAHVERLLDPGPGAQVVPIRRVG
jgi:integrase